MFSGIIEAKVRVLYCEAPDLTAQVVRVKLEKPNSFNDLRVGDSIAVNGVCLTLEAFDEQAMRFCLGFETLKITGWQVSALQGAFVNVERSLKLGDRVHGHIVTGHVDGMGEIVCAEQAGENLLLTVKVPSHVQSLMWPKGSVCLNGVSLTLNSIKQDLVEVCLIPETLRVTNLATIKAGDFVTVEADQAARGLKHFFDSQRVSNEQHP